MNVAIEVHIVVVMNSCKDWVLVKDVESIVEYEKMQSIISKCDT